MLLFENDMARRLRLPGYIVVGYMTVGSLIDIVVSAQPVLVHDIRWRLGVSTLLTAASGTELLGALLFLGLAIATSDVLAMWVGFTLSALFGCLYLGAGGVFSLDAMQMRGQVKPEMLSRYDVNLVWTLLRILFTGVVLLIIAGACLRAARALARVLDRSGTNRASTLVVGNPPTAGTGAPANRSHLERTKEPTT